MTEREKMLAGLIYTSADRELAALNARAKKTVREYNDCAVEDGEKRKALMRSLLGGCGRNFGMEPPVRFDYGCNTYLGENFFANYNLTVLDCAEVRIGNNVMCGPNVTFATPVHPLLPADRNMRTAADGTPYDYEYARPITVEDDVWIASCVTITGGVTIGRGSVIGAGSVVTRDVPAGVFAAGVPCRVIRNLTENDKMEMPE